MKTLSLSKPIVFIALLAGFGIVLSGCPKNIKPSNPEVAIFPPTEDSLPYKRDELVVLKKPAYSQEDFKNWLDTFARHYDSVKVQYYCASCDSSLVLLKGPGIALLLEGVPAGGTGKTKPAGKLTGGDGPAYISVNFKFYLPKRDSVITFSDIPQFQQKAEYKNNYDDIVVAVFDSGIDPALLNGFAYTSKSNPCLITTPGNGNARNGWNFADHNGNLKDENEIHHGSVVTKFITDQAEKYHNNRVRILPVKLFGRQKTATLFDVLCALSYAKDRGAKVINASFGFYTLNEQMEHASGFEDDNLLLFKTFLKKNIDSANIILVAAAGNKDISSSAYSDFYNYYETTNGFTNLDSIGFYPASLSGFANNIIAVTTINQKRQYVSPHQNHSDSLVGVGVIADRDVSFINPFLYKPGYTVEGSSFATPIITGKIAANYFLLQKFIQAPHTRDQLLQKLSETGLIEPGSGNTVLKKEILHGNYTQK